MKKLLKLFTIALALNIAAVSADEDSTGVYISIGQNWFNLDTDRGLSHQDDLYLGFGYQATDHVAFELRYSDFNAKHYSLSSLYRYQPRTEDSFFWKAGLGKYSDLPTGNTNLVLGAGYETHFNQTMSLTFGLDSMYQFNNDYVDWVPYVGFNFFFGGSSQRPVPTPAKPEPVDSDGDGVVDTLDQCSNTAKGVSVDSQGCPLDGDKDGVFDSLDQCPQTPLGAKVDTDGCRIVLTENVSIKLDVKFANDSNVVSDDYRTEIKKVADFMREYPDTTVVIEGHTDSRGAATYNQNLSQRRAIAVMQYLVAQFTIDQARVTAVGKGEVSPIADNNTADGRATNRRVQAEIKTSVSKPQ